MSAGPVPVAGTEAAPGSPREYPVVLTGRLTAAPTDRELPSGLVLSAFRISVPRVVTPLGTGSRQRADWVDCVTAVARCRRSVHHWEVGDAVEVSGVLRRRFLRDGGGSRLEVEALRVRRAAVR